MLRRGFKDADGSLRQHIGSDFYDDIVFLLKRINSLPESKPDHISIVWAAIERRAEPILSSRPLERADITDTPDHWLSSYWKNAHTWVPYVGSHWRVLPTGERYHQRLFGELEKVEFNHDLPSGETRTYSFDVDTVAAPTLIRHWINPQFNGAPYAIDNPAVSFEETITPPTPETWLPPQIQIEYTLQLEGRKQIVTNVRCTVCGAVDKQKYPKMNLLGSKKKETCNVNSEYLCAREACVRSRSLKQNFDIRRLFTGYRLHPYFMPPIDKTLMSWVRSQDRSEGDANLKCKLRYALDTRGRRGIKFKNYENDVAAVAPPSGIHTADSGDSFAPLKGMADRNRFDSSEVRYFENDFVAKTKGVLVIRPVVTVTDWWFDPSVHKSVGLTFEEKRYLPNYNCFGPVSSISDEKPTTVEKLVSDLQPDAAFDSVEVRDVGFTKSGIWAGDPLLWSPGHGFVYPLIPFHPEISKLDEIVWRKKVRVPFDSTRVFKTLRDTTGAADEIRQKQLNKLEKIKSHGPVDSFIEDIYVRRNKGMKQVAKELDTTPSALKQKVYRTLNKPVVTEVSQWTRAIESSNCDQDGIYAVAVVGGQRRAYLILAATQFTDSFEDNQALIEDGLHNIICDVLERRIKKNRVKTESDLKPMYREVYDAFNRFGWRMLRDGVWHQEDQTEVPVLSLT
jgi:hypothetical protein